MKIVMLLKGGVAEEAEGSLQVAIAASYGPEVVSVTVLHSGMIYQFLQGVVTWSGIANYAKENPFFAEHFNLQSDAA